MSVEPRVRLAGRAAELADIASRAALAEQGIGGLVRLRGPAGIGKSAIARAASLAARQRGFDTAWSGCWQTAAVPPLHPLTRVIDQLNGPWVAPDLETGIADPDAARVEQAARVETWLRRRAGRPTLIVLDDLHWADAATLAVLEHLADVLASLPVLVIGAHRPPTAGAAVAFASFDAGPRRPGDVIDIEPLGPSDCADMVRNVAGDQIDTATAARLIEITGGNPLFIRELARALPSESLTGATIDLDALHLPGSLRAAVTDRVAGTGEACRELLDVLSVAGDEVPTEVVADACELDGDALLDALAEAIDADLVERDIGVARYRHALLRAAVYESLSSARRALLHDRIGHVLLARRGQGHPVEAAALAHHFGRAAPLGNASRVYGFAVEAAADAARMLSFDLAARRYAQALAMLGLDPTLGERGPLLLELADAQVAAGDIESARASFRQAAEVAAARNDAATLGRAALGLSGGLGGIEVRLGDPEVTRLLEMADAALTADDVLGPRVLARLSIALSYRLPVAERAELATRARDRAMAGEDPGAIAEVLAAWCDAMAGPDHVPQRVDAAAEIIDRAMDADDLRTEALGRRLLVEAHLEQGDLRAAERQVDEFERVARRLGRAEYLWYPALWRGTLAFARARPEVAAAARVELESLVDPLDATNAGLLATVQLLARSFDTADTAACQDLVEPILAGGRVVDDASTLVTTTLIRALDGELGRVTGLIDRCIDLALAADLDSEWPAMMLQLVEIVQALGGHARLAEIRAAVESYGSVWAIEGIGAGIRGPLDRALGILAALAGDLATARARFDSAHAAAVRAGADLTAALVDHDAGRLLDDPDRLDRAERIWHRIGASRRLEQIGAHRAGLAPPMVGPGPGGGRNPESADDGRAPGRNRFVCDGDVWSITFDGMTFRLADRKGLRDLARLLAEPGREIAALDLAAEGASVVEADHGEAIDLHARTAYRNRLADIDLELDEADAHGDIGRSARLGAERDALLAELSAAYGLGGRARRSGGSGERARTAVRSRVRAALDRIGEVNPGLGRHLERSIRTGTFCVYDPDPHLVWDVRLLPHTV